MLSFSFLWEMPERSKPLQPSFISQENCSLWWKTLRSSEPQLLCQEPLWWRITSTGHLPKLGGLLFFFFLLYDAAENQDKIKPRSGWSLWDWVAPGAPLSPLHLSKDIKIKKHPWIMIQHSMNWLASIPLLKTHCQTGRGTKSIATIQATLIPNPFHCANTLQ